MESMPEPLADAEMIEKLNLFARLKLKNYAIRQWPDYRPAAHHRLIADKLEAVERGEIKRLMIFMPPRMGKSQLCSEFFPAWYLGRNPDKYIITATYSQELAEDFGRKVRNQLQDPLFNGIFPECHIAADSTSSKRFNTEEKGSYFAVGVGGSITGRGAHLLVIDDPVKGREDADSETMRRKLKDWYQSVAYTRLMPGGAIIIIQTRWHSDDLSGWLLKEHEHESWDVVDLPAIDKDGHALWESDYPKSTLLRIQETIGERDWSALYQQRPVMDGGNILKRDWWKIWDKPMPPIEHSFMSWDTAYTEKDYKAASYSAMVQFGVFWDEQAQRYGLIMMRAWWGRVDYPDLRKKAQELEKEFRPDVHLIEKKASGQSLIQDLRRADVRVRTYMPDRDKVSRAYAVSAMLQSGQVYMPDRRWADDVAVFCAQFPNGTAPSSDLTDCVTQALLYLRNGYWVSHPDDDLDDDDDDDDGRDRKRTAAYG